MSYLAALPLMAALIGSVMYYLWHGEGPKTLKDRFFPTDAHGQRWSLPTYMKDLYAYGLQPGKTIQGKIHPLARLIWEMITNRDYLDRQIANPNHPLVKRAEEMAEHAAEAFKPMSVGNIQKAQQKQTGAQEKVLPFVGITPAPGYIDHPYKQQRVRQVNP